MRDTIFALATARGRAGVAVMRLSGPQAFAACQDLCGSLPPLRHASLRNIRWQGEVLDQVIVLVFESGSSFTGEDVVEFHAHGGLAVVQVILRALGQLPGLRPAEAGEFTRRALESGVLDLTQVEGLADLIDAETEAQRKQAARTLSGEIGKRVESWRQRLIRAAALLEATIDFADEDVPVDVTPEVKALLTGLASEFAVEIAGTKKAEQIRHGFEVAIVGAPNAGKSTLLNRLAGRDAAITSSIAGTTRDVIEVRMELDGQAVTLLDTAGLRDSSDPLEREGIRRALERAESADLRIFLGEGAERYLATRSGDLIVHNKSDVNPPSAGLAVSGKTGAGVDTLLSAISSTLAQKVAGASILIRERHSLALQRGLSSVEAVLDILGRKAFLPEIAAEELRRAIRSMDALVGRVDVESLLDEIFSSFCIGK